MMQKIFPNDGEDFDWIVVDVFKDSKIQDVKALFGVSMGFGVPAGC